MGVFYQRADSLGLVTVDLGDLSPADIDSVRFTFHAPSCVSGRWPSTLIDGVTFFEIARDSSTLGLILDSRLPPARTAPGEYCARGYPSGWAGGLDIYLALRVDSLVGPLVYGRWETGYNSTRSGDVGSFVGGYGPTFVALDLVVDRQWNTCAGFRLTATVHPDGTWETAAVTEENGCDTVPMYFDFVEEDTFFGF